MFDLAKETTLTGDEAGFSIKGTMKKPHLSKTIRGMGRTVALKHEKGILGGYHTHPFVKDIPIVPSMRDRQLAVVFDEEIVCVGGLETVDYKGQTKIKDLKPKKPEYAVRCWYKQKDPLPGSMTVFESMAYCEWKKPFARKVNSNNKDL